MGDPGARTWGSCEDGVQCGHGPDGPHKQQRQGALVVWRGPRRGQDHGGCPGCRLEWTMCFQGNENVKVIQMQLQSSIGEEGFALSNLKNGVCSGSWRVFSGRKRGRLNEQKWFGGQGGGGQS